MLLHVSLLAVSNSLISVNCKNVFWIFSDTFNSWFVIYYYEIYSHSFIHSYHLHVLEKCLNLLQEVRSIIYFRQFFHPPSVMFLNSFFHLIFFRSRTRCYRVSNSCSNVLLSGKKRECQSFDVCPTQHLHNFFSLMIVLVRGVLSAKQKFEAIL